MLIEIELGDEALAFIRSSLETNTTLSSCLLRLPLNDGKIHSYLPFGVSPSALSAFEAGGIASANETQEHLVEFIFSYLNTSEIALAVFESYASPGDPFLKSADQRYFVVNNEVYYYLTFSERTAEAIGKALRWARNYPFVCALTSCSDVSLLQNQGVEVSLRFIEALASRTKIIVVGAYDEEAYLLWTSPSQS